jgi:uncharacterized protein
MMFVDTSGLVCLYDDGTPEHSAAKLLFDSREQKLTTNYVLAEFIAVANARRFNRTKSLAFARAVVQSNEVETIFAGRSLHERAMRLLETRLAKTWSLCNAISMELMRDNKIFDALTTDHHFIQAGFNARLRQ